MDTVAFQTQSPSCFTRAKKVPKQATSRHALAFKKIKSVTGWAAPRPILPQTHEGESVLREVSDSWANHDVD